MYTTTSIICRRPQQSRFLVNTYLHSVHYMHSAVSLKFVTCPFQVDSKYVHCKCLQGFTGALQGNQGAGISNLWGLWVTCNPHKCNGEMWVSGSSYITNLKFSSGLSQIFSISNISRLTQLYLKSSSSPPQVLHRSSSIVPQGPLKSSSSSSSPLQ